MLEYQHYLLTRTGDAPMQFDGKVVAKMTGPGEAGAAENRYYNIVLYATKDDKWVCHLRYTTRWKGETDRTDAVVTDEPSDVVAWLRDYDPLVPVAGYPSDPKYNERQRVLKNSIKMNYEYRVGMLLADAGGEFAEEVGCALVSNMSGCGTYE